MDVVWRMRVATVRDVVTALSADGESAYTTVMTIMTRLTQKGLLKRKSDRRAYVYTPAIEKDAYIEAISRGRVRGLIEQFGDVAVAQFAEELERMDPDRARRWGELLAKRGKKS